MCASQTPVYVRITRKAGCGSKTKGVDPLQFCQLSPVILTQQCLRTSSLTPNEKLKTLNNPRYFHPSWHDGYKLSL